MMPTDVIRPTKRFCALAVVAVLVAACGGGDDTSNVASEGGVSTTIAGSDTTAVSLEGDTGEVDTSAAEGASTETTVKEQTSGGGKTTVTTTAPAKVKDDTAGLPAAGTYRFHTTGTSKFGAQPSTKVDEETVTTVTHLGGGRLKQASEEQEAVLEWTDSAVLLHTLDFKTPGFERHFEAKPPVQYAPLPLTVGKAWKWKLTAQGYPTTLAQDSRVDRVETITVSGKKYDTTVIITKITLSGDVSGTIDLTQWVDTSTNTPVRTHAKTDITTFTFSSDTTSDFIKFTAA